MIFLKTLGVMMFAAILPLSSPVVTCAAEVSIPEIAIEESRPEGMDVNAEEKKDELAEELWYDDLELLAQIVEAEAGNQDLTGRRLVVDVVLNRVNDPRFPGTIREVIYQGRQFSCLYDGNFERAGNHISDLSYEAVRMNAINEERLDTGILYFSRGRSNGRDFWKYGDHWFSY